MTREQILKNMQALIDAAHLPHQAPGPILVSYKRYQELERKLEVVLRRYPNFKCLEPYSIDLKYAEIVGKNDE